VEGALCGRNIVALNVIETNKAVIVNKWDIKKKKNGEWKIVGIRKNELYSLCTPTLPGRNNAGPKRKVDLMLISSAIFVDKD
jgi:hypothetical protein